MKQLFTFLFILFAVSLNAQTFSTLDKQTVKFDAVGKIKEVCNYYSFPSNVYYMYWFQYNPDGKLNSVSQHTYQGFGKPWYKKPDSTDIDFKFTYKYNAEGRKIEECYYNNYRSLETRCTYEYKGDSALTVTRYDGWGKTIENKTVFKLHIVPEKKDLRPRSTYVELYEKTLYDSLDKVIRKIKYNYGKQQSQEGGINPHYGQYSVIHLYSVQAFNKKGKLLEEHKRIELPDGEGFSEYKDTIITHIADDSYTVEWEDRYEDRNGNDYGFNEDANPRVLDYLNCSFDSWKKIRNTCMWWNQEQYCAEKSIEDMMDITVADLHPDHEDVTGK